MIANWMAYLLVLSLLLSAGALLTEEALLRWSRPARGVWVAALAGLFVIPLGVSIVGPLGGNSTHVPVVSIGPIVVLGPVGEMPVTVAPDDSGVTLEGVLLFSWLLGSGSALGYLMLSRRSVRTRKKEWRRVLLDKTLVWRSTDLGPAVVGFQKPEIVVPAWVDALPEAERALLLRHEKEHISAGDPSLWLFGLAVLVVFPWNPLVWWQVKRLRGAIEVDCDSRVLNATRETVSYGTLLLKVARLSSPVPLAAAAFSARSTQLERRVRVMTRVRKRGLVMALVTIVVTSLILFSTSWITQPAIMAQTPDPVHALMGRSSPEPAPFEAAFEVIDSPPELIDREAFRNDVADAYPAWARQEGIAGSPIIGLIIDETGTVTDLSLVRSSGHNALDDAALDVVSDSRFVPGVKDGHGVTVYLLMSVSFTAPGADAGGIAPEEGSSRVEGPEQAKTDD